MTERVQNTLVGIVSIIALLALAALLMLFGEFDELMSRRYLLTINTDHASGLRRGSDVELNGVPIGVIEVVTVHDHPVYPVRIEALIDPGVAIPEGSKPYATTSLLGASAVLEIVIDGGGDGAAILPRDGSAAISEPMKIRMLEKIAAELDVRMRPVLAALESFQTFSDTYIEVGRNVNALLVPRPVGAEGEGAAGATAPAPTIADVVAKLYDVLDRAEEAFELAREWLGDEQLRSDAKTAVANATSLIDKATHAMEDLSKAAGAVETDATALVARVTTVADELALTLEQVRELARRATEGDGTVARLLNRPDLHESLLDATIRLERVLREVELFIQKAKAEGLPIRF
jgi:phospholipid/cholesterol/gamma-HCH transport system substrate-binding protein